MNYPAESTIIPTCTPPKAKTWFSVLVTCATLSACGGGGRSEPEDTTMAIAAITPGGETTTSTEIVEAASAPSSPASTEPLDPQVAASGPTANALASATRTNLRTSLTTQAQAPTETATKAPDQTPNLATLTTPTGGSLDARAGLPAPTPATQTAPPTTTSTTLAQATTSSLDQEPKLPVVATRDIIQPKAENWTSLRSSYDVHAVGKDRFLLEGVNSTLQSPTAKFTVKPGDNFGGSSGERSEIVIDGWRETSRFKVFGNEGIEYYRVSVKLGTDWISPQSDPSGSKWGTFLQAHGPDEFAAPPAVSLNVDSKFSLFILGGDMNKKIGGTKPLTNSTLNVGKWVEFILKIKWAPDATGSVTVFRRDEGANAWVTVADVQSIPTLQYRGNSGIKPHYWKTGFYRSESQHINSLSLGPIIRARAFSEVKG